MKTTIKVGSDFSGVGAFNQALMRLGINYQEVFACDMDKYARQTFIHNYGEPEYYPMNVYDREIPKESLDIYMTSPPCQAFSMAGKRLGKEDERGILFFNSLEFIRVNNPRFFIFENVKGLLSHDKENKKDKIGRTFQEWIDYLGGKSVNGITTMIPIDGSVPYHLHYKVLNAKKHGVPQNRERVFLIGIRNDQDNTFTWPEEEELTKRLKDVLESEVDDKYFLSIDRIESIMSRKFLDEKPMDYGRKEYAEENICKCLKVGGDIPCFDVNNLNKIGYVNQDTQASAVYDSNGVSQTMTSGTHGYAMGYIHINSATSKGYEEATEGDSINFSVPNSQTRRGRVGKGVAQTLDTACNQGVIQFVFGLNKTRKGMENEFNLSRAYSNKDRVFSQNGISPTIMSQETQGRYHTMIDNYKIRRLTPRECFRLMDFPDTFIWPVSDSQAYKQAGNSIVVRVLEKIINNLPL